MEAVTRIILVLEILLVNLLTSHWSMKKRYSNFVTFLALTLFSVLLFSLFIGLRMKAGLPPYSGGILIFIGFVYVLPLKQLYEEPLEKIFAIMLFSWTHTLSVRLISREIVLLSMNQGTLFTNLFLQTAFFLFTTPILIRFINKRFAYIINNIPERLSKYLLAVSLAQCILISMISYKINEAVHSAWPLMLVLMAVFMAGLNYMLLYIIVKNSVNTEVLEQLVYKDSLTGTDNRLSFLLECRKRIEAGLPFITVYMDVDNLKKVNDLYGHTAGDHYLKAFAKATKEILGTQGKMFRLSGDEFVCLLWSHEELFSPEVFEAEINSVLDLEVPFLGVSIGHSLFPTDGMTIESLLNKADGMMYKTKEIRRQVYFKSNISMVEK